MEQFSKLPGVFKLTNTEPFAAWFVASGDVTADEIRVVRSVLGAISCHQLPSFFSSIFPRAKARTNQLGKAEPR